ncbi:MAG TPA: type VI secretion system protein TssA [Stellaceae bacterium]|nr:type VI secretion system protein TssA [Stellaceae bacterium]
MTAIDIAALLEPISADSPSGEAIEYDAQYIELETAARGKPEQELGDTIVAAEEPDWREVERIALELCARSKDLRVAVYLTRAALKLAGLEGLKDGLELIHGYLARYWDSVHPQLDPEDDNDPSARINIIASLCDGEAMLRPLRACPLTQSRQFGRVSYRDFAIASGLMPLPPPKKGQEEERLPDSATIEAAFADSPVEVLAAAQEAAAGAIEAVGAIEAALGSALGAASGPDLEPLRVLLRDIKGLLDQQLAKRGVGEGEAAEGEDATAAQPGAAAPGGGGGGGGVIRGRADVTLLLDKICRYYADHEPSSPVPLLLERAKRLATMNFIDILRDMTPDGVPQLNVIAGIRDEDNQ